MKYYNWYPGTTRGKGGREMKGMSHRYFTLIMWADSGPLSQRSAIAKVRGTPAEQ